MYEYTQYYMVYNLIPREKDLYSHIIFFSYLCQPTWDGVPCSPEQLEKAATFCIEAREEWNRLKDTGAVEGEPHILIHCAHGRGR